MAEQTFQWSDWLVSNAQMPLREASRANERLLKLGVVSIEDLEKELKNHNNFLISPKIGLRDAQADKVKEILRDQSASLSIPSQTTQENMEIVMCSSGRALLAPGRHGKLKVTRKIALPYIVNSEGLLLRERGLFDRILSNEHNRSLFPIIYGIQEDYEIPSSELCCSSDKRTTCLVMERSIGNLYEYVENIKGSRTFSIDIQPFMCQAFDVMTCLHETGLVWLDLNPQNYHLYQPTLTKKLFKGTGFDHSVDAGTRLDVSRHGYTLRYAAPEQVRSGSYLASPLQDYWSFGLLLIWIACPPGQDMYSMIGLNSSQEISEFLRDDSLDRVQAVIDEFLLSFKDSRDGLKRLMARAAESLIKTSPTLRPANANQLFFNEYLNSIRSDGMFTSISRLLDDGGGDLALSDLVLGDGDCPGLCIIVPDPQAGSIKSNLFSKLHNLYFICPVTLKIGNAYNIQISRQTFINACPAIRIGLAVLKLMLQVSSIIGSNFAVPPILESIVSVSDKIKRISKISQAFSDLSNDDVVVKQRYDEVVLSIESLDTSGSANSLPQFIQDHMKEVLIQPDPFSAVKYLLPQSERSLTALQSNSGLVKVTSSKGSLVAWVNPIGQEVFRRHGAAAFHMPMPTAPVVRANSSKNTSLTTSDSSPISLAGIRASSASAIESADSKERPEIKPMSSFRRLVSSFFDLKQSSDDLDNYTHTSTQPQSSSTKSSKDTQGDGNWTNRACINEFDCRRVIVFVLKKFKGDDRWNEGFDWQEDAHLHDWKGKTIDGHTRVQVDEGGMVTELLLMRISLKGPLSDVIGNLTSLTTMNLSSNEITSLPDSIGRLTLLVKLNVNRNKLSALPETIGHLSSLTHLSASYNPLTALPMSMSNLTSITHLLLTGGQLTVLPDWFGRMTTLIDLNVSNNQLTSLPSAIVQLRSLENLYASSNRIVELPMVIGQMSSLKLFVVNNNPVVAAVKDKNELRRRFEGSGFELEC